MTSIRHRVAANPEPEPPEPSRSRRRPHGWRRSRARIHECRIELDVPFHDVDAFHVVWHGHYYKYLELARTRLLRSHRLDGRDLVDLGFAFVMIESGCCHAAPLRYGDRVRVTAWLREVEHRLFIAYEVTNLTLSRRAAWGHTILATTARDGRMLLRTPPSILARLSTAPLSPAEESENCGT